MHALPNEGMTERKSKFRGTYGYITKQGGIPILMNRVIKKGWIFTSAIDRWQQVGFARVSLELCMRCFVSILLQICPAHFWGMLACRRDGLQTLTYHPSLARIRHSRGVPEENQDGYRGGVGQLHQMCTARSLYLHNKERLSVNNKEQLCWRQDIFAECTIVVFRRCLQPSETE